MYKLIDRLKKKAPTMLVRCSFGISTSCFYDSLARTSTIDRERCNKKCAAMPVQREPGLSWLSGLDVDDAGVEGSDWPVQCCVA